MSEDKNKSEEEVLIEVPEEVVQDDDSEDVGGLSAEEVVLAKKHGLIKEEDDGDNGEDGEVNGKDNEDKKSEKKEDDEETDEPTDPATFEEMEEVLNKDKDKFHKKFTPNAKALYFKHKKERNERQRLSSEIETLKAEQELNSVKDSSYAAKLAKVREALGSEDLTVEKLSAILGEEEAKKEAVEEKKPDGKTADKVYMERVGLATEIGNSKYENFEAISDLVQEMVKEDKTYADVIANAFQGLYNNTVDEEAVVEKVVKIAMLSPKFKELGSKKVSGDKKVNPEDQKNVDRAIKNSNKKPSSASLSSSGKSNFKSEDTLTPDDVVNFSTSKWMSLTKKTRDRLLKEAS